jgi:hypothetical protein
MKRMIRAAASAALLTSGLGSFGCVNTDPGGGAREEGHGPIGDCWRNAYDPCYPDRYIFAAREATLAPFAQQVVNGHALNQTIFNFYFEFNSDGLSASGIEKLNSLARTRPAPDPKIFLATARDLPPNIDPTKLAAVRNDLDARRADVIQKFLASQPAFVPVAYEVLITDPVVPSIYSEFAANAYRGSLAGVKGGVSGAGTGVLGTGGGGTSITSPATGGGAAPGGGFGAPGGAGR